MSLLIPPPHSVNIPCVQYCVPLCVCCVKLKNRTESGAQKCIYFPKQAVFMKSLQILSFKHFNHKISKNIVVHSIKPIWSKCQMFLNTKALIYWYVSFIKTFKFPIVAEFDMIIIMKGEHLLSPAIVYEFLSIVLFERKSKKLHVKGYLSIEADNQLISSFEASLSNKKLNISEQVRPMLLNIDLSLVCLNLVVHKGYNYHSYSGKAAHDQQSSLVQY